MKHSYSSEEETLYISGVERAHIWNIDGNKFIDNCLGNGSAISGYEDERLGAVTVGRPPAVVKTSSIWPSRGNSSCSQGLMSIQKKTQKDMFND
ncbi:MAG: hypothetical protein JKY57_00925 [Kordiimonadaceae bacterium]|nr:hypothetical protein [Kordiimonadaceae bacterium]